MLRWLTPFAVTTFATSTAWADVPAARSAGRFLVAVGVGAVMLVALVIGLLIWRRRK